MSIRTPLYSAVGAAALLTAMVGAGHAVTCTPGMGEVTCNTGIIIKPTELVNENIELPLFDDDGGNLVLTEVRLFMEAGYAMNVKGTNPSETAFNLTIVPQVDFEFSNHSTRQGTFLTDFFEDFQSSGLEVVNVPGGATIDEDFDGLEPIGPSFVDASEFGNWIAMPGDDTFSVTLNTDTELLLGFGGGQLTQGSQETFAGYFVGVRYTFVDRPPTDVIPLPAAGWMLLTGLLGLGGMGWYRRRTG